MVCPLPAAVMNDTVCYLSSMLLCCEQSCYSLMGLQLIAQQLCNMPDHGCILGFRRPQRQALCMSEAACCSTNTTLQHIRLEAAFAGAAVAVGEVEHAICNGNHAHLH